MGKEPLSNWVPRLRFKACLSRGICLNTVKYKVETGGVFRPPSVLAEFNAAQIYVKPGAKESSERPCSLAFPVQGKLEQNERQVNCCFNTTDFSPLTGLVSGKEASNQQQRDVLEERSHRRSGARCLVVFK